MLLRKVATREAEVVGTAMQEALGRVKKVSHIPTLDNSKEFAQREGLGREQGIKVCLAGPCAARLQG